MQSLMSNSALFYFCIALLVGLVICFYMLAKQSARIKSAIKLINELHQLNTHQNELLEQFKQPAKHANDPKSLPSATLEWINSRTEKTITKEIEELAKHQQVQFTQVRNELDALDNQVEQLVQDDPALKMYSRANQLAKSGASIEDIMEACQLPRAEVEVLVSLQSKSKG